MTSYVLTFIILIMTGSVSCAASDKYSAEEQEKNRNKWSACESSEECAVIQGECELTSVNKKYLTEAELYYHRLGTMVSCAGPKDKGLPRPVCHQNKCECEYPMLDIAPDPVS